MSYLLVCGDFNGHVGKAPKGFNGIHGGHGFGSGNADGTRILDLCTAENLAITNTQKLSRRALIPQLCYLIQIQKQMVNQFG